MSLRAIANSFIYEFFAGTNQHQLFRFRDTGMSEDVGSYSYLQLLKIVNINITD